jgi:nucleotide-binding universal stress UspA family protein
MRTNTVLHRHIIGPATAEAGADLPTDEADPFGRVVCATDGRADTRTVRRQALLLAAPGAPIELVSVSELTRRRQFPSHVCCDDAVLLAIGSGTAAHAAVEAAASPILVARQCPLGTEVTDTILVVVNHASESGRAVEIAGRLAGVHGGAVTLLAAPRQDLSLAQAIAASSRRILTATGVAPRVLGEQIPPERTVPPAAARLNASLVVLESGGNQRERRTTARIAGAIGCSVLVVPARQSSSAVRVDD